MELMKVMLVTSLALASTWAAEQFAPSGAVRIAQVDTAQRESSENPAEEDQDIPAPVKLEEPSQAEIDADLERIRKAWEINEDLEEFEPQEPVSADIAVEFPSDF